MSFTAKIINLALKISGMKKLYLLPEDEFLRKVKKMNEKKVFYVPTDNKAIYKKHRIKGRECLIVQKEKKRAKRAVLYFFGGGMMVGPDKGYIDAIVKLAKKSGCDIWYPMYPLCVDHCITETYEMIYECYKEMVKIYGGGNVSTCGFSSGGALAIGVAAYNNTMQDKLPQPHHIVAVSPGEVPWNDEERSIMKENNSKDPLVDYAFMEKVEKFEKQGREDVPEFMIHMSKGDFSGVNHIHFVYSKDEVLYGAKQNFIDNCEKYQVKYTIRERSGMFHCYALFPYFKEAKEDFEEIAKILAEV
ncbi:MAG: alpha/beta hydrolase fold domain-containing protein [Eubacterium sp.]|nr:alpha/beta hydrolase fold domain-containing protein [Eubacterium sp.]